ncbi:uncharacterized protein CMC5_046130 [Chondromyces crocatus]|uniref:DUF434 domain-containing protein n=1 Tax=Chondromyces crocatus TaxID=52 RepID=A0A0K1EIN9_CHOCO|nr:uncharacterized protein CMC5_046130 [Chondromyces crocatus]
MSAVGGRGAHAGDGERFGGEALVRLRAGLEEVNWLLGRGYPLGMVVTMVGNHHQFDARQRMALTRAGCSEEQRAARRARCVKLEAMRGAWVEIDGLNLLITLEVAQRGGPLLLGADGALRDLAGVRGSYAVLDETERALGWVEKALQEAGVAGARWWIDEAVSSSGRLRGAIEAGWGRRERAEGEGEMEAGEGEEERGRVGVEAGLVRDPDAVLRGRRGVVSSDGVVLDRCESWVDLAGEVVRRWVRGAWVVNLLG